MTDLAPERLCPGCFADKGSADPCPHCGYAEGAARGPLVLPHRTLLNGQLLVGRVLGRPGGFGIAYLGFDLTLHTRLAIKEYLPRELAGRATDRASVAPHAREEGELFRYGLEQFLGEARTLARLDHPNIVRVRQFFEANATAYLVMDYYEGISLAEHLEQQGGRLPEESAKALLLPVLDGLRAVHARGFLHRDIKPENIYLARTDTGGVRPILIDFGAARQAMGERSRSLSVVVSAGYAPFEQYQRSGRQGPWTDIYAAAAVLYRAVTGTEPPEATERIGEDDLKPASAFGVSKGLSDALGQALAVAPEERPQSVPEFQARLRGEAPASGAAHHAEPTPPPRPRRRRWVLPALLVPLLAAGGLYLFQAQLPTLVAPNDSPGSAQVPLGPLPGAPGPGESARAEPPVAAPAPPPPVVAQGYLQVSVNVAGASVAVDGSPVGEAAPGQPLKLAQGLPAGEAEVVVGAPGYREQRRAVTIEAETWAQVDFSLAEVPLDLDQEGVRQVQAWLNALGYDAGAPDGAFGPKTRSAVAAYQRDQGEEDTGALGASLHRRLEEKGAAALAMASARLHQNQRLEQQGGEALAAAAARLRQNQNMRARSPSTSRGVWSYYAVHYARVRGCILAGGGAVMVEKTPGYETHRVYCEGGQTFLVRCNAGMCQGAQ